MIPRFPPPAIASIPWVRDEGGGRHWTGKRCRLGVKMSRGVVRRA
jgi:hypothetical protein